MEEKAKKRISPWAAVGFGLGAVGASALGVVGYAGVQDISRRYTLGSAQVDNMELAARADLARTKGEIEADAAREAHMAAQQLKFDAKRGK